MSADGDIIGLITLSVTLSIHLIATVWWAASLTRRVDHIEKWITNNAHTAERLAAVEQQISNVGAGITRIEHHLRHHK
jgi:hypothetical protein